MTDKHKKCSACNEVLPLDKFGMDRQKSDGLYSKCRTCKSADNKNYIGNKESDEQRQKRLLRLAEFMGYSGEAHLCEVQKMVAGNVAGEKEHHWCWAMEHAWTGDLWFFNPMHDWNHWRQVEEKVMEDVVLHARFEDKMNRKYSKLFMCPADLSTRCKALVSVLPPLCSDCGRNHAGATGCFPSSND